MTKDKLVDTCIISLNVMNDIIDIMTDRIKYETKDKAYDAIRDILLDNNVLCIVDL